MVDLVASFIAAVFDLLEAAVRLDAKRAYIHADSAQVRVYSVEAIVQPLVGPALPHRLHEGTVDRTPRASVARNQNLLQRLVRETRGIGPARPRLRFCARGRRPPRPSRRRAHGPCHAPPWPRPFSPRDALRGAARDRRRGLLRPSSPYRSTCRECPCGFLPSIFRGTDWYP